MEIKGDFPIMKHITRKKIAFLIADIVAFIVLVALDQFTKVLAVEKLKDKASFPLIRNVLELQYLENKGAAFGMLQNQKAFFISSSKAIITWNSGLPLSL